jgi:hypothetical protein
MVIAESTVLKNIETGKIEIQCSCFKTKFLEDYDAEGGDETFRK